MGNGNNNNLLESQSFARNTSNKHLLIKNIILKLIDNYLDSRYSSSTAKNSTLKATN